MQSRFNITRRTALVGAAVGGVLGAPAILRAQGQVRLTLGHGTAPGNPRYVAAERLAAQLRERSQGRIEMRVAGSAQLGDDLAMLTGLRTGTLDMSVNSQGPVSSVVPELAAFGLPFLFPTNQAAYRVIDGSVGQEIARKLEAVGLISLGWWDNGIRHITNSKRPDPGPRRPARPQGPHPRRPRHHRHLPGPGRGDAADQLQRALRRAAAGRGRRAGEPAGQHPLGQAARSEPLHLALRSQVGVLALRGLAHHVGPAERSRPHASSRKWRRRRPSTTVSSCRRATPGCLPSSAPTRRSRSTRRSRHAFRAATAPVLDKWEQKPIGDFVKRLRAGAAA